DGNLPFERHERFQDQRDIAHGRKCTGHAASINAAENALPLAIIAQATGLEHAGTSERQEPLGKLPIVIDRLEARCRNADAVQERFLDETILCNLQRPLGREDRELSAKGSRCRDRHILEFVGDDVANGSKLGQSRLVVIGGRDVPVGHLSCGAVCLWLQHRRPVAETCRGHGKHPAKLSAANDADDRSGRKRPAHGCSVGSTATAAVWSRLQASSRAASSVSDRASTAAASRAALMAPALPIASVPTGTPAGICTMERSESCPDSALDSTGTPKTGKGVNAAVMPGRCAAPPAPAMMTR